MDVIEKALMMASQAHENQYRKKTKIPYITHPVAVGMILMKAGYGDDLVAAGILHDTVEDTPLTLADIEESFGPKIAKIVEGCSEPDKSLPWEERKNHTIEFLKTAPLETRAVVSADKLHNIRSIIDDYEQQGEEVWNKFKRGRDQQKWYYTKVLESLGFQSHFQLLDKLKIEVDRLFK
ncbi:HD domain-containing protein [Bacillus sp. EB600]|uniref:HD domain-containing protein n=1 Tax=Bacillus sp. EB600 TaxID=2806345 RepID=UPI00210E4C1E|nr:HD domain-containing protein [Bacillus sp. EB600]MCQ6281901.1 bifunctional (p)ppGpp synthetase/guanosine-3',5'-bis(diphosphate) 3'-pyrophosphohydrolase [Bacillus sp. EB600]